MTVNAVPLHHRWRKTSVVLSKNADNSTSWIHEQRRSFRENWKKTRYQKETLEIPKAHKKERQLGKYNTHMSIKRQKGQWKTADYLPNGLVRENKN